MAVNLVVALDFDNLYTAEHLVEQLDPRACALKVGSEMFTLFGPAFVKQLVDKSFRVFLDLKFHDIPSTVAKACQASAELGVWMVNLHACGGRKMMDAARIAIEAYGETRPLLIAVTVLTSMNVVEFSSLYHETISQHVERLAKFSLDAGLDGVVSSALEVPLIKACCGQAFLTVTPGIRLDTNSADDQSRVNTPSAALKAGSDYLVVGRPITSSENPMEVVHQILQTKH
jgi:orotidine-5'-phosphate decarboxylase